MQKGLEPQKDHDRSEEKRMLRYLMRTKNFRLYLGGGSEEFEFKL